MVKISDELVQEIIELGHGNLDQQHKAFGHLFKTIFNKDHRIVDPTVIERLVPTFVHFLTSKNPWIQRSGAYCLAVVTETPDFKTNYKLVIQAGALPKLVQLLTLGKKDIKKESVKKNILKECLISLKNITYSFPGEVAKCNAISPLLNVIISNIPLISFEAARVLKNLSHNRANILGIIGAGSIQILTNTLKSNKNDMCQEALEILVNIVKYDEENCKMVLDSGALELVKKHFLHPTMKPFALEFIENMLYSENVDHILDGENEKFLTFILKQINISRVTDEIKTTAIKIMLIIVQKKPGFVPKLINDYDIISLISDNLASNNPEMVIIALSAINDIIEAAEYETVRQTLIKSRIKEKVQKYCEHENDQIKEIKIKNFFISKYVQRRRIVEKKVKPDMPRSELEELESSSSSIQNQENGQKRKAQPGKTGGRKKLRVSMAPTETSEEDERPDNISLREPSPDDALAEVETPLVRKTSPPSSPISFPNPLEALAIDQQNNQEDVRSQDIPDNVINPNEALPTTDHLNDNFTIIVKNFPSWQFFDFCCKELLGIEFDKNLCLQFLALNKFTEIKSTSKPASCLQSTTDKTGFSCFSMIFCGKDDPQITDQIKQTINKFINRKYSGKSDTAKRESIIFSSTLTEEHIKIVVEKFKFRILVYFNEGWKKFGDFGSEVGYGNPLRSGG